MNKIKKILVNLVIVIMLLNIGFPMAYAVSNIEENNKTFENITNEKEDSTNNTQTSNNTSNNTNVSNNVTNNIANETTNETTNVTSNNTAEENTISNTTKENKTTNITNESNEGIKTIEEVNDISINSEQTIENGTYEIKAGVGTNKLLDVANSNNNVQIWDKKSDPKSQRFDIKYNQDGYYTITLVNTSKVLDVYGGYAQNGTNVQIYEKNGSEAQKWIIKKETTGKYSIISKGTGLYLDIYDGASSNGTNVDIYQGNNTPAQQFEFQKIEPIVGEKTIEDGTYEIKSGVGANKLIDVAQNDNVQIWDKKSNQKTQRFDIKYNQEGYYTITLKNTSKVLDVYGGYAQNGTNVQVYQNNGSEAQKWIIKKETSGKYSIISKGTGLYLDVYAGALENGTNVDIYTSNGSIAQQFEFQKIEPIIGEKTIEDGTYEIKSGVGANKLIDVAQNDNVQIWDRKSNQKTQRFDIKYNQGGYYTITLVNTSKVLDVYGGYSENGTNVQVYQNNGSDAQKWIIKKETSGKYSIISKGTELYLDVYAGALENGTNVDIYESNGSIAQQFEFQKVDPYKEIEEGNYEIQMSLNQNKIIDISTEDSNARIWEKRNIKSQKFYIKEIEKGYYTIKAQDTGKVLDVYGGHSENGTNVQAYAYNGSDAQKWKIILNEDGTYSFQSKSNGLNLDVYGGETKDGTNLQVYTSNGSQAQRFIAKKVEIVEGKQSIENGTYKIKTKVDENKVLEATSGSNIQINKDEGTKNQKFEITYIGNGNYKIELKHSGKTLNVENDKTTDGTNVNESIDTESNSQKWIIKQETDGYYSIIAWYSDLYLDVYGGYIENGTNVDVYTGNGSNAQRFKLEKTQTIKGTKTIEDGIYKIQSALNTNKVLDISSGSVENGANVQLWESSNVKQQYFYITYIGNGNYEIEAVHSEKMLDVYDAGLTSNTNVQQSTSNKTNAQKWIIKDQGNEKYSIISECNDLYLDVSGASSANGTNIDVYKSNNSDAQRFKFKKYNELPEVSDGSYRIRTALSTNMALDIAGGSTANGANLQIWNSTNVLQQKFQLVYNNDGYYTIKVIHSNKVLEVAGGGITPGTNVQQYESNNSDAQKWIIKNAGDGYYYIISKLNGLYLDVNNADITNGTNISVYTSNQTFAQKFSFDEVYFGIDVSIYQGDIDYDKVKATGKADFVIARVGYGRNYEQKDEKFERNYSEAKRLNMALGTYIYSYASDVQGAIAEAENALRWLNGRSLELPVFYDLEDKAQDGVSKETLTQMAIAFGERIKQNGYKVGVYANKSWLINRINVKQLPNDYAIWVAAYGINNGFIPEEKYEYIGNHDIWQYSSAGQIDGIQGGVDVNVTYRKAVQEKYFGTEESKPNEKINYTASIENTGWTGFAYNGEKLGTINQSNGIQKLKLNIKESLKLDISYRAHNVNGQWLNWASNGNILESNSSFNAIEIKLNDYSKYNIKYRVYMQAEGWTKWGENGTAVGNANKNGKLEAIQILIYEK